MWVLARRTPPALTPEGQKYFTSIVPLQLVRPLRREVLDVTGIADAQNGPNMKEVHFTWRYIGLTDLVARYIGQSSAPHGVGVALFRLYDDGWRTEGPMEVVEGNGTVGGGKTPFKPDPNLERAVIPAKTLGTYIHEGFSTFTVTITDTHVAIDEMYRGELRAREGFGFWENLSITYEPRLSPGEGTLTLTVPGEPKRAVEIADRDAQSQRLLARDLAAKIYAAAQEWSARFPDRAGWQRPSSPPPWAAATAGLTTAEVTEMLKSAVLKHRPDLVRPLIQQGADVNAIYQNGFLTPRGFPYGKTVLEAACLEMARKNNQWAGSDGETVKLLRAAGAKGVCP